MYEAVISGPKGASSVSRLALTAATAGYDGLVVRREPETEFAVDIDSISDQFGIDVVDGIELRVDDPSAAAGRLGRVRQQATILVLRGGTESLDRYAVGQERIDVLAGFDVGAVDMGLLRTAARTGVHLMVDLGPVLRDTEGDRATRIRELRRLTDLLQGTDATHVVTGGARTHLQLRSPRELCAVGATIGIGADFVESGLREWQTLAERNRERQSAEFVEPGVRRLRGEK